MLLFQGGEINQSPRKFRFWVFDSLVLHCKNHETRRRPNICLRFTRCQKNETKSALERLQFSYSRSIAFKKKIVLRWGMGSEYIILLFVVKIFRQVKNCVPSWQIFKHMNEMVISFSSTIVLVTFNILFTNFRISRHFPSWPKLRDELRK